MNVPHTLRRHWIWPAAAALTTAGIVLALNASADPRPTPGTTPAPPPAPDAASSERTLELPTSGWKPGNPAMTALRTGIIRVTADGCPYLAPSDPRSPATRTPLIWPARYTARYGNDGKLQILAPNGAPVAREDTPFSAGGGMIPTQATHPCLFNAPDAFVIMQDLTR
ncbi:hypothetical protein [Kribbella sp. CA-247076]|uniref:hypothetical protein n=1 Tax=Kribbella sp. CA-247076 TaxID=3239941 RepID=UPI003D8FEFC5